MPILRHNILFSLVPDPDVHLEPSTVFCISSSHKNVKFGFAHMIIEIIEVKVKSFQTQRTPLNRCVFPLFITHAPQNAGVETGGIAV
jgi:hypothetical protein